MVMPDNKNITKECKACSRVLNLSNFHINKSYTDGFSSKCKECKNTYKKTSYIKNIDKERELSRLYYYNTLDYQQERKKIYYKKNKLILNENSSKWKKENRDKVSAYSASRRAKLKTAMPSWLTKDQLDEIKSIFSEAKRLTEETGTLHHVDHIEPINGDGFTGLHVPWNLRVIPHYENESKGNRLLTI